MIERYRKEIDELKNRLEEREREVVAPASLRRRLSAREKLDENKAMHDLSSRIKQLTKLILTSQTVEEGRGDEVRRIQPFELVPILMDAVPFYSPVQPVPANWIST